VDSLDHGHEFFLLLEISLIEGGDWNEGVGEGSLGEEAVKREVVDKFVIEGDIVQPVFCLLESQAIEEVGVLWFYSEVYL